MELIVPFHRTLKVHRHTHSYLNLKANKLPDPFTLKAETRQRCVSISVTFLLMVLGTIRQGGEIKRIRIEKESGKNQIKKKN